MFQSPGPTFKGVHPNKESEPPSYRASSTKFHHTQQPRCVEGGMAFDWSQGGTAATHVRWTAVRQSTHNQQRARRSRLLRSLTRSPRPRLFAAMRQRPRPALRSTLVLDIGAIEASWIEFDGQGSGRLWGRPPRDQALKSGLVRANRHDFRRRSPKKLHTAVCGVICWIFCILQSLLCPISYGAVDDLPSLDSPLTCFMRAVWDLHVCVARTWRKISARNER